MSKKKRLCEDNIREVIARAAEYNGISEETLLLKMFKVFMDVQTFVEETYYLNFFTDEDSENPINIGSPAADVVGL